ncbi:MAG: hypothetical protein KJ600_00545 [Nanoarchaeota archaeon]|nr:hypothetical protein [Nanoarchaeota archaeon]MBU1103032.1 hypothetical protein [Nanoarchaeota archaeon]
MESCDKRIYRKRSLELISSNRCGPYREYDEGAIKQNDVPRILDYARQIYAHVLCSRKEEN